MTTASNRRPSYTFAIFVGALSCLSIVFSGYNNPRATAVLPTELFQGVNWTFNTEVKGVEFYHAITACDGRSTVFLRVINKNNYKVNVSWKEVFDTQNAKNIEGFGEGKKLAVSPGESSETSCTSPTKKELVTGGHQVNPTYIAEISKFNYKDISVTR